MRIPWAWIGAVVTAALMLFVHWRLRMHWVPAWFVSVNAATFALFGADKLAAIWKLSRVREVTLHLFALIGGSPGALLAQRLFHHKVSKRKFIVIYWLIVALQIALIWSVMYTDLLKETIL